MFDFVLPLEFTLALVKDVPVDKKCQQMHHSSKYVDFRRARKTKTVKYLLVPFHSEDAIF